MAFCNGYIINMEKPSKQSKEKTKTKKKKKKKKGEKKRKRPTEEGEEGARSIKHDETERCYRCEFCSTFATTNPVIFSNHVRTCKVKHTTTTISDCLRNQTVSLSLWTKPTKPTTTSKPTTPSDDDNKFDESYCRETLASLGATFSATVHKKTTVLLATSDAVKRRTQRVRKAAKKKIPIVLPEWLEACKAHKSQLKFDDYLLTFVPSAASAAGGGGGDNGKGEESEEGEDGKEVQEAADDLKSDLLMEHVQHFDLGCCCGCHDNDPPLSTCEWCPQCYA